MSETKRPIIGVYAYKNEQQNSFGVGITHLDYLSQFGDIRIIMPHEPFVEVDMLYMVGGLDLNPSSYGQIPGFRTSNTDVFKQYFYDHYLDNYIKAKTPIFAVCLGFQMLACKFNCKLTQHLIHHADGESKHEVQVFGSKGKFTVNSRHHQGVTVDGFNKEVLDCLLYAKDEGDGVIIEAFKHKELPIVAVQYHPKVFGAC